MSIRETKRNTEKKKDEDEEEKKKYAVYNSEQYLQNRSIQVDKEMSANFFCYLKKNIDLYFVYFTVCLYAVVKRVILSLIFFVCVHFLLFFVLGSCNISFLFVQMRENSKANVVSF